MQLIIQILRRHSTAIAIVFATICFAWILRYDANEMGEKGVFIDHWTGQIWACGDNGKCSWIEIPK